MLKNIRFRINNSRYKKIYLATVCLIVCVLGAFFGAFLVKVVRAFPNSILSFAPATRSVGLNQTFTLDAMIDPRTNQLTIVELHVTFDPTRLRLDNVSNSGSPFSNYIQVADVDNINGVASVIVAVTLPNPGLVVPVTNYSKVATFYFYTLATGNNLPIAFTAGSRAAAFEEGSTDVITDRIGSQITVDAAAPTGGSINYTNGYFTAASIALTVNDGTDLAAGINPASRIVQRHSAALSGTTCGAYGTWTNIGPAGTYPNFIDNSVVTGNCYQYRYLVSDNAGNQAIYTSANTARVDTVAPVISQVTAVTTPTSDTTPNYVFTASEAGNISYTGDCSSATTTATSGANTITFNALSSGTHSNCTVRVTDAAGNQGNILAVNSFTIDASSPTITSVTSTRANGTYGPGAVIDIVVNFSETVVSSGSVTVNLDIAGRSCSFVVSNAATASCNYAVQSGDNSADLTTTSITGTIRDQLGNTMTNFTPAANLGANKNIVINAVKPSLGEITPIPSITNDSTPNYTFSSSKAGTITYSGDCISATTAAAVGNNTITFNTLSIGTHSNCAITVTDSSGSVSTPLDVSDFVITYRADFDLSRDVDLQDFQILLANFNNTVCGNVADVIRDCDVNIFDFNVLAEDFGKSV